MTRRIAVGALVVAGLLAALTVGPPVSAPSAASAGIAISLSPALLCENYDNATLRDLRQGDQRVVVAVKAFDPAKPPGAGLVVWLLSANKTKRQEVARLAVHPLRAFKTQETARQQRFLISLNEYAALIEDGQPLCLEVGFDTVSGKVEGGRLEVAVELVQTAKPTGK